MGTIHFSIYSPPNYILQKEVYEYEIDEIKMGEIKHMWETLQYESGVIHKIAQKVRWGIILTLFSLIPLILIIGGLVIYLLVQVF